MAANAGGSEMARRLLRRKLADSARTPELNRRLLRGKLTRAARTPELNRRLEKRDLWAADLETPSVPDYRGRKANYRSGTASVGKRYTGASTGTGAPKKVQPTRVAGRKTPGAGITMRDESKPPIDPSLIGKGFAQRALGDYTLSRSALYGRAGKGRRKEAFKIVARQLPRMYAHQAVGAATGHAVGTAVARQRGLVGAEAKTVQRKYRRGGLHVGSTTGYRASSRRSAANLREAGFKKGLRSIDTGLSMARAHQAVEGEMACKTCGGAVFRHSSGELRHTARSRDVHVPRVHGELLHDRVGKRDRSYNPEHNRQRRLGVATAATGLGGLALMAHGGHGVREATRIARRGIPFAPTAGRPAVILEEQGKKTRVIPVPQRVRQRADDLHSRGITASRRDLGEIGGGAGLVGTSAGIHRYSRSRSNREYH